MLKYNYEGNMISTEEKNIILNSIENGIFNLLYKNKNKVCTYEQISQEVFKRDDVNINTIRTNVKNLRDKTEGVISIRTICKRGYIIDL